MYALARMYGDEDAGCKDVRKGHHYNLLVAKHRDITFSRKNMICQLSLAQRCLDSEDGEMNHAKALSYSLMSLQDSVFGHSERHLQQLKEKYHEIADLLEVDEDLGPCKKIFFTEL